MCQGHPVSYHLFIKNLARRPSSIDGEGGSASMPFHFGARQKEERGRTTRERSRAMKQKRAYRYRFHPTYEQEQLLARTFGCVRYCYNWALHLKTTAYRERGECLGYGDLSALLTIIKQQSETIWLNEVSCVPLQQSLRHLNRAFVNFFKGRAASPKFKRKGGPQAAEYTKSAFTWDGTSLTLAKMREPLAIVWSRPLPAGSLPSTVTVSKDTAGRYFVSI